MAEIDIDDVVLIDHKTVKKDGRIYVGTEHAEKEYKIILLDPDVPDPLGE